MHFKSRFIGPNTHQPKPHMSPGRPERSRKDRPVILSAAKDLAAHRARPFAALRACPRAKRRGDMVRSLRLMRISADLSALGGYSDILIKKLKSITNAPT